MKRTMLVLATLLAFGTASLVSACNTTRGLGEDMQAGGNALSNSAEKNKPY
jgi:predicted small secreted protein